MAGLRRVLGAFSHDAPWYATAEGAVVPGEERQTGTGPVFVVSGFMRSGTSMMMRALETAGMPAVYNKKREEWRKRFADDDYDPNAGGLYELTREEYAQPGFPKGYEGRLIKCLRTGPGRMNVMPGGILVVWMLRDNEERRQSYNAFFNQPAFTAEEIAAEEERNLALAKNRRDTRVLEVPYRGVVENPRLWFERIRNFFGYPFDTDKACSVVDPEQYRFRIEELEVGVV